MKTAASGDKMSKKKRSGDLTVVSIENDDSGAGMSLSKYQVLVAGKMNFASTQHRVDKKKLYEVPLIPVNCMFGIVTEKLYKKIPLQRAIYLERKRMTEAQKIDVTVVFAIRRPGCGACREHGRQLSHLIDSMPTVNGIGIIKETSTTTNDALLDFYNNYYTYPIYKDAKWTIYKETLGNRKVPLVKFLLAFRMMNRRYVENNIVNIPFGGDLFTQGGVLIFDKDMKLRSIFHENYTQLLNMYEIRCAIEEARKPLVLESTFNGSSSSNMDAIENVK